MGGSVRDGFRSHGAYPGLNSPLFRSGALVHLAYLVAPRSGVPHNGHCEQLSFIGMFTKGFESLRAGYTPASSLPVKGPNAPGIGVASAFRGPLRVDPIESDSRAAGPTSNTASPGDFQLIFNFLSLIHFLYGMASGKAHLSPFEGILVIPQFKGCCPRQLHRVSQWCSAVLWTGVHLTFQPVLESSRGFFR